MGASASVAHDALNKFFRFNVPVVYFDDIIMQRMSCINSGEGDVVVVQAARGFDRRQDSVDLFFNECSRFFW